MSGVLAATAAASGNGQASLSRAMNAWLADGTMSVPAGTTLAETTWFPMNFINGTDSMLTNVTVHGHSAEFSDQPDVTQASVDPGGQVVDYNLAQDPFPGLQGTLTVPFDSSRTSVMAPAGLSTQTLTFTITPQQVPLDATSSAIDFQIGDSGAAADAHFGSNAQVVSAPAGASITGVGTGTLQVHVENVTVGATYTVVATLDIQNDNGTAQSFSPFFAAQEEDLSPQTPDAGNTSYSIVDPDVTATFSADQSVPWTGQLERDPHLAYPVVLPPSAAPSSPTVNATAYRFANVALAGDSIANQSYANGVRGWRGDINNFQSATLHAPDIQLDTVDPSWAFTPTPTLPADSGTGADLAQGQQFSLSTVAAQGQGTSEVANTPVATGFDATRDAQPLSPNVGDTQTDTLTITLDDSMWAGQTAEVDVFPADPSQPSNGYVVNGGEATLPTFTHNETANSFPIGSGGYAFQVHNAALGVPYSFQVPITAAASGTYKPFVTFRAVENTPLVQASGTSTSIADPFDSATAPDGLGGTWTFSSSDTATWNRTLSDVTSVSLTGVAPAQGFTTQLQDTSFSGPSNSRFTTTATVTGTNGFSGPVNFFLAATDNGGAPPQGLSASGTVNANTSGTVTVRANYTAAPGTYNVYVGASGQNVPATFTPVTIVVQPYFTMDGNDQFTASPGDTVDQPLTLTADPGFSGPVSFELGSYVNGVFTPGFSGLTPVNNWPSVQLDGTNSPLAIDLPFTVDSQMTPGSYTPAIRFGGTNARIWLFDLTVSGPAFALSLDQSTFTVPAGSSFTTNATIAPDPGFSGTISFYLSQNKTPPDWPADISTPAPFPTVTVPGQTTAALTLSVDNSVAPGTDLTFYVGANAFPQQIPDRYQQVTVHVTAALPAVTAQTWEGDLIQYPAGTTSATHGVSAPATYDLNGYMANDSAQDLHDAAITADATSPRSFPGAPAFPVSTSRAVLAPSGDAAGNDVLDLQALDDEFSDGHGSPETASPHDDVTITAPDAPPGGGTVTVKIDVTPQDAGDSTLNIDANPGSVGATITAVRFPATTDETVDQSSWDATYANWTIDRVHVGQTYELQVDFQVENGTAAPATWQPYVHIASGYWVGGLSVDGSDASLAVPALGSGGHVSFHTSDTVHFSGGSFRENDMIFKEVALPQAQAQATVVDAATGYVAADTSTPTDGVTASQTITGFRTWSGELDNLSDGDLPAPHIHVDGSSLAFTPAVTFPLDTSQDSLAPQGYLLEDGLDYGSAIADNQQFTPAVALTRTVSPAVIPAGGGTQTVTITATLQDPAFAGQNLYLSSYTDPDIGDTVIDPTSISWPATPNGEQSSTSVDGTTGVDDSIWGIQVGQAYTLSYSVYVPNSGNAGLVYRPLVQDSLYGSTSGQSSGSSVDLTDPILGGTFSFSLGTSATWDTSLADERDVHLESVAISQQPVDHFVVKALPSSVAAGSPLTVTITPLDATNKVVTSYRGPVKLTDSTGTASFGDVTWSNGGVGSVAVTVPDVAVNDQVDVSDASTGPRTAFGSSGLFQVYGPIDHFKLFLTPATPTAGVPAKLTVMSQDALNRTIPWYTPPASFTLSNVASTASQWPALTWTKGVGTTNVTYADPVNGDRIDAADGDATGSTRTFNVVGALDHFKVTVASLGVAAGAPLTVYITPQDALNDTVVGYTGTSMTLADTAPGSSFGPVTWTNGGFGRTTITVPAPYHGDVVTVADGSVTADSVAFNVLGSLDHLKVQPAAAAMSAGSGMLVYVTALDALNDAITSYTGGSLTIGDLAAGSFGSFTWSSGVGKTTLTVASPYKGDVVSAADGGISASSTTFNVVGPVTSFKVTPASTAVDAGSPLLVYVTARDALNDAVPSYNGASLALTDLAPSSSFGAMTWSGGTGKATLTVPAPYKGDVVTATDRGITASSVPINILGPLDHLNVTMSTAAVRVGVPITVYVTGADALNDTIPAFNNTALTISDLASDGTFGAPTWVNGLAKISATFAATATGDRISAVGGGVSGQSALFNVK